MQKNNTVNQAASDQIMTLNFLVMKHICETLLPSNPLSTEQAGLQLIDAVGFEPNPDFEGEDELLVMSFLKTIGYKTDEVHEDDDWVAEIPLPNPVMADVVEKLKAWWSGYSSGCKTGSIGYSSIDVIFANYGQKSEGRSDIYDCCFEHFDKLMMILCGETFNSVYDKITRNPFIDFVAPGKRYNTYSVSVSLFKREQHCGITDTTIPAQGFYLPMQLVTANPAVIGKNLTRMIGRSANSLVDGGFAGSHMLTDLTICKNGQKFVNLPVSFVFNIEGADNVEAAYLQTNQEWETLYELDFHSLEVIRSDRLLLKTISDAMPEKDKFAFLAAHFSQDLGL